MSLSKEQMRKRLDGKVIELDDVGVPSLWGCVTDGET